MIRIDVLAPDYAAEFQQKYEQCGGFPVDVKFLLQATMYSISFRGQRIGGFLINEKMPFRSLNDMPEQERLRVSSELGPDQCFETMCYWLERKHRKGFLSAMVLLKLMLFILRYPKKKLLISTVSDTLMTMYGRGWPRIHYTGRIQMAQGSVPKYVLTFYPKYRIILSYVRNMTIRLQRKMINRRPAPGHGASETV